MHAMVRSNSDFFPQGSPSKLSMKYGNNGVLGLSKDPVRYYTE